jgi:hypothetical protein
VHVYFAAITATLFPETAAERGRVSLQNDILRGQAVPPPVV